MKARNKTKQNATCSRESIKHLTHRSNFPASSEGEDSFDSASLLLETGRAKTTTGFDFLCWMVWMELWRVCVMFLSSRSESKEWERIEATSWERSESESNTKTGVLETQTIHHMEKNGNIKPTCTRQELMIVFPEKITERKKKKKSKTRMWYSECAWCIVCGR